MKVKINALGAFVISFFLTLDQSRHSLLFFFAVFFHEIAHIIAIKLFRGRIHEIKISPLGLEIVKSNIRLSLLQNLVIDLSGPFFNLFLAIISLLFDSESAQYFFACNIALASFNLIPIKENDGGKAFSALLFTYCSFDFAEKATTAFEIASCILLCVVSIIGIFCFSSGIFVCLFSVIILLSIIKSNGNRQLL